MNGTYRACIVDIVNRTAFGYEDRALPKVMADPATYPRFHACVDALVAFRDEKLMQARTERDALPTQEAYETACEALEKRRVALVQVLAAPEGMGFYAAVDMVAARCNELLDAYADITNLRTQLSDNNPVLPSRQEITDWLSGVLDDRMATYAAVRLMSKFDLTYKQESD